MKAQPYLYLFYGFLINPLINLPVFFLIDPTYDNLSYIGTTLHHPFYLLLWGTSSALGFYFLSIKIWQMEKINYKKQLHLLLCLGMVISCLIPYSPQETGLVNDLHVWIAILCVTGFLFEWIQTIFSPSYYQSYYHFLLKLLLVWFALCFLEITRSGSINGLSEVLFSIGVNAIEALYLFKQTKKSSN